MDGAVWQAESAAHGPPTPTDRVCDLWSVTATILLLSEVQHRKQTDREMTHKERQLKHFIYFQICEPFPNNCRPRRLPPPPSPRLIGGPRLDSQARNASLLAASLGETDSTHHTHHKKFPPCQGRCAHAWCFSLFEVAFFFLNSSHFLDFFVSPSQKRRTMLWTADGCGNFPLKAGVRTR